MFNSAVLRMNLPTRSSYVKDDERPRSHQPHLTLQELQLSKCRKTRSLSPAELLFHLNRSHVLNASISQTMRISTDALWRRSRHPQHLHKNARRWMAEFKMRSNDSESQHQQFLTVPEQVTSKLNSAKHHDGRVCEGVREPAGVPHCVFP